MDTTNPTPTNVSSTLSAQAEQPIVPSSPEPTHKTSKLMVAVAGIFGLLLLSSLWWFFGRNVATSVPTETQQDQPVITDSEVIQQDNAEQCETTFSTILASVEQDYSECSITPPDLSACTSAAANPELNKQVAIELILDSSGSMAAQAGGETKMTAAKRVLTDFTSSMPTDVLIGLRVYGHKGSNSQADKAVSCANSELIYPLQAPNTTQFTQAINSFQPTGWTPIAASLQAAATDFSALSTDNTLPIIYLVSDGIETCGGDPIAAVQQLQASGVEAIINVIGFAVDTQAKSQLQAIANSSGGEYFDVQTAAELDAIFDKSIDEIRAAAQYRLCITREEQQYRLANTREYQQYALCVQRKASRERLDAQSQISKQADLSRECTATLRDRFEVREDYLVEQAKNRSDLENILLESKARETDSKAAIED